MSTIAGSDFRYKQDDFGEDANVGDIIVRAAGGYLIMSYILGFTKNGIYVSQSGKRNHYTNTNLADHNSRKYMRYINFKIVEKNSVIPEILLPLCYLNQM